MVLLVASMDLCHLEQHLNFLLENLTVKKITVKKQQKITKGHFTVIDLRLLRHSGYEKLSPDGSLLQELDMVLSYKKQSGLLASSEWAILCSIIVFPAFGGDIISPRCPLPIGEAKSITLGGKSSVLPLPN